ncbi:MAG: mechanosensitive ion channel family protein, partial [Paracoccaceae bacterium]
LDKAIVVVPNSAIITGTVLNWMHGDKNGRVSVPVEVAYGTDPEKVKKLLLTIASKHVQVLDEPEPQVVFRGFGESALQFELRAYINTKFGLYVKSEINFEIAKAFEKNKIEIPFPQRDVNIRYAEAPKK